MIKINPKEEWRRIINWKIEDGIWICISNKIIKNKNKNCTWIDKG